jgi:hypothetical protein
MRSVSSEDSQYSSPLTVARVASLAKTAIAAAGVDLANDTFADELGRVRRRFDDAYELVADRPFEAGVALEDLKIGITNPGKRYADECFLAQSWNRNLIDACAASRNP